jgi:hypothetical protein
MLNVAVHMADAPGWCCIAIIMIELCALAFVSFFFVRLHVACFLWQLSGM